MKMLSFILSLVVSVPLVIVCAGVDDRLGLSITNAHHTLPLSAQIPDEQIHVWSGYAALSRSAEKSTDLSGLPGTEDFGGSWPGPRW